MPEPPIPDVADAASLEDAQLEELRAALNDLFEATVMIVVRIHRSLSEVERIQRARGSREQS